MTKILASKIIQHGLGKSGDSFDNLTDSSTTYKFEIRSNPINSKEKIFWVSTISKWTFENNNYIDYGCDIFFNPIAYNIINPTFEDLLKFTILGTLKINKVLTEKLEELNLPNQLELQPILEERDYPLIEIARISWSALN